MKWWPVVNLLFWSLSLLGPAAFAQDDAESRSPQAVEARDEEVAQRAKHRQYPGGPDESDLKVQNPMPEPTRKMAPTVLDHSEPSGED